MKKRLIVATCGVVIALAGCGAEKENATGLVKELIPVADSGQQTANGGTTEENKTSEEKTSDQTQDISTEGAITKDQALEAIKNYCFENNSDLEGMLDSEDYTTYFEVYDGEQGEIVVLFRSYTGAQSRYYVDPKTGDTYGTELVPGIIDEEQRTEEFFNVKDYMNKTADSAKDAEGTKELFSRADGERYEGTIILEGMEEKVQYEHAVSRTLGFEIDYEYEFYTRYSSAEGECFISVYDDASNPEDYLEIEYWAESADAVVASISEELSKEYEISTDIYELDNAGPCTRIDASANVGGQTMPEHLQKVYIIPDGEGTIVGTAHYNIEGAEGTGRRFMYMMNTLHVIKD
ncbi:hypothetical protein [Butyrivibrio sp. AE3009]|uniref:hypothetical protein n=1 Tax=Butyrivibrio sp. AE3009 TaxID=1280666 RepID=UPI0003B69B05|nr:hypothetical protein [Butyrivibrio sp. AE3009]